MGLSSVRLRNNAYSLAPPLPTAACECDATVGAHRGHTRRVKPKSIVFPCSSSPSPSGSDSALRVSPARSLSLSLCVAFIEIVMRASICGTCRRKGEKRRVERAEQRNAVASEQRGAISICASRLFNTRLVNYTTPMLELSVGMDKCGVKAPYFAWRDALRLELGASACSVFKQATRPPTPGGAWETMR